VAVAGQPPPTRGWPACLLDVVVNRAPLPRQDAVVVSASARKLEPKHVLERAVPGHRRRGGHSRGRLWLQASLGDGSGGQ
jgi:hypothetical protein